MNILSNKSLLIEIFLHLDYKNIHKCSMINKQFYNILSDDEFWKLYCKNNINHLIIFNSKGSWKEFYIQTQELEGSNLLEFKQKNKCIKCIIV